MPETKSVMMQNRVIITGADSTARVIAENFLARGDRVAVCDINPEAIDIVTKCNEEIFAHRANVGDANELSEFLGKAIDHMDGVDTLINVVGVAGPTAATEDVSLADWESTFRINTTAMFLTARAVIPHFKAQGHGAIVNFSTASTKTGLPNRTPYIVTKCAVEGLTRNLARELGPFNVRVNAILPGPINNDRLRQVLIKTAKAQGITLDDALKNALRFTSMHSTIEQQEIADLVVFLCSRAAGHISGQLIGIDGNLEWEE